MSICSTAKFNLCKKTSFSIPLDKTKKMFYNLTKRSSVKDGQICKQECKVKTSATKES